MHEKVLFIYSFVEITVVQLPVFRLFVAIQSKKSLAAKYDIYMVAMQSS